MVYKPAESARPLKSEVSQWFSPDEEEIEVDGDPNEPWAPLKGNKQCPLSEVHGTYYYIERWAIGSHHHRLI